MTGQKTWVVGEEVLAPDFNNYVQSQVVAQFATVAARDAWSTPANGALCVTTDTNTTWQRVAGAWRPVLTGGVVFAQSIVTADLTMPTIGTFDLGTFGPPAVPYPTMLVVTAAIGCGNGNPVGNAWQPSLQRLLDAVILIHAGSISSPPGLWTWRTLCWAYPIAAGASGSVKARVQVITQGGSTNNYGNANISGVQYAT